MSIFKFSINLFCEIEQFGSLILVNWSLLLMKFSFKLCLEELLKLSFGFWAFELRKFFLLSLNIENLCFLELSFNKLKQKEIKENLIIDFFPFSLYKQNQEEIIKKDIIYNKEEATLKALEKAKEQVLKKLKEDEYIIYQKILLINVKDSKIIIEVFFSVYEDITELELEWYSA